MIPLLAMVLVAAGSQTAADTTEDVTRRYLDLTFSQQYQALHELYHPMVLFSDPTGDVWGGLGDIRGRDSVIATQQGWGLTASTYDIDESFTVGQFALYRGQLAWTIADSPEVRTDFVTVLRVTEGLIAERYDYGNYVAAYPDLARRYRENNEATRLLANEYFKAYLEQRHDDMLALTDDSVTFQDPTAAFFGGPSGNLVRGKQAFGRLLQRAFAPISSMEFRPQRQFVSNHHAVFMGTISYRMAGRSLGLPVEEVPFEHSAVFVVEVEDGRVTSHRDYVDYSNWLDQRDAALRAD